MSDASGSHALPAIRRRAVNPWLVAAAVVVPTFMEGLILRELRIANPVVNLQPLAERNFMMACIIIFCAFGVLYGASTLLPGMLQALFGYDAFHAGLVMSPSGIFAIMTMIIVGALLGRGIDARWLIGIGLCVVSAANFWMAHMNLDISPGQVVWPRVVMILGLSMTFAPLSVAAYMHIPRHLRGAAVGLFSLLRNEGGSVGTSVGQTLTERREQFHTLRLGEFLDPLNPATNSFLDQSQSTFLQQTGDPALSQQMAWQNLANVREQQALALAYFDCFWLFAVVGTALVLLVPLMRRSAPEKGAHAAAE